MAKLGGLRDLRDVAHQIGVAGDGHVTVANVGKVRCHQTPLGPPFGQTAIEDRGALTEQAEQPPQPRRRKNSVAVINHDCMTVPHAHLAHPGHELFDRWSHVRQSTAPIADVIQIDEARAGDMRLAIFFERIAVHIGQIPRRI